MRLELDHLINRRRFLRDTSAGLLAAGGLGFAAAARGATTEDGPNTHNMLIFGDEAVFLSHLPMFDGLNSAKTAFSSPHRYQVVLQARFMRGSEDVTALYRSDRKANPKTRFYTLRPEEFVVSHLFTPAAKPERTSFQATIFRGHLELDGVEAKGLERVKVEVTRVVHGRQFEPTAKKPAELEYLLVASGRDRFLAHAIVAPPDFDHVLPIALEGATLTESDLGKDIRVIVSNRKNTSASRLRAKDRVSATLRVGTMDSKDGADRSGADRAL